MPRIIIISLLSLSVTMAQTASEIALQIDQRPSPVDMTSDMTMLLTSKTGKTRTLTVHTVRKGEGRMILWFTAPADDRGVAFLTIERESGDEMRMWLPSFKKMRRISTNRRGDSFMGSDLSFEDLTSRNIEDYSHNLLGEELVNGEEHWLLENIPNADLRSSYSRIVSVVRKHDAQVIKELYYDRAGELIKERTVETQTFGAYSLPVRMVVRNVQKNHSTELTFANIEVDTGVKESLFHERNLRRLP
ncbi:MAG: outer membrane lipoprotein-sorting protein [Candidatus Marinimicrobia bacterium]|nr:outer membrane lipoprotein-sorting protein [Candidatus Neomarinimicrobiota bacterium]